MKNYNLTQLHPFLAIERNVVHRDMLAHIFRWSRVLKIADSNMNILDFGCGSGGIYELFYRNRFSPKRFLGIDIRKQTIEKNKEKFPKAEWKVEDLVKMKENYGNDWDIITSFEVAEHIGKQNVSLFLENIKNHCNENTIVLISTPCYDEKVGAADNHIYDAGDGRGVQSQELTFEEMKILVEEEFEVLNVNGTFSSKKDIYPVFSDSEKKVYDDLHGYYDSNILSIMFAPLHPEVSRNCIWTLKKK